MLRLIQISNSLPSSFICDPSAEFMPGQMAQLTVINNQVMATVSNGVCPIGIIDSIRIKAFTSVSWNQEIVQMATGVPGPGGSLVTPVDIKAELKHAYIIGNSFESTVDVSLNPTNGVIKFLAGTPLNYDAIGSGTPNAIRTIVNYTYRVANMPGDDSTIGSGRMTVWVNRMFFSTDQYETNTVYEVGANLYCSETGLFTTRRPSNVHPALAMVTGPPTSSNIFLEGLWY